MRPRGQTSAGRAYVTIFVMKSARAVYVVGGPIDADLRGHFAEGIFVLVRCCLYQRLALSFIEIVNTQGVLWVGCN